MVEQINTVTGPISVEEMGKTLIHEHFVFGYPGFQGDVTLGPFKKEEALEAGIQAAKRVMEFGVKTVVDPTPNECGRNPEVLKEISVATGLQIICATGYYYEGEGAPPYFKFRQGLGTADAEIYEMFIKEITDGIAGTGIRPGIIKLGSSKDQITPYEQMFFKAAAKAHQETGIMLLTHTEQGTMGPDQAKMLIELGVDPGKILIGHMCGNTNLDYHRKTLETGVTIGFDRFGIQGLVGAPTDDERVATLMQLLEEGYAKQIMLSHDSITHWLGRDPVMNDTVAELVKNWHPTHLFENIVPALEEKGVSDDVIDQVFHL